MTPLYGHVSQDTAYLVEDYPYGFKLRCKMRCWLESDPKRGHRFVTQTTNPKKVGEVWNAPKRSTYTPIAACMYLDDQGQVHCEGFTDWKSEEALLFVQRFPRAAGIDQARAFTLLKIQHQEKKISGERYFTINGVRQPYSDAERERDVAELDQWRAVYAAFPKSSERIQGEP